jgi:hypothetical protein
VAWTGSGWYADTFKQALAQDIALDLELDTHKLALYNNTLTPDFSATDPQYSSSNEISGTGYTAGGKVVTGTALSVSSGFLIWDGDNVQWDDSTLTGVRGGIIYADALTGNNLIIGINFAADYATAAGTLLVAWHANGVGRFDAVP